MLVHVGLVFLIVMIKKAFLCFSVVTKSVCLQFSGGNDSVSHGQYYHQGHLLCALSLSVPSSNSFIVFHNLIRVTRVC